MYEYGTVMDIKDGLNSFDSEFWSVRDWRVSSAARPSWHVSSGDIDDVQKWFARVLYIYLLCLAINYILSKKKR